MSDPNQPGFPPPSGPPTGPPAGPPGFPPPGPPPGFPPPGPPGPPGAPPSGGGRGNGLWIALGVVGVIALVGVIVGLVLVLTGDDDKDEDGKDDPTSASQAAPAEVVESLLDAAEDGDCDKVKTYLTATAVAADPCSSAEFQLLSTEDVDAAVGDAQVDGSAATVPVTFASSAGSTDYEFRLEQVDGAWRVASYTAGASTDGPTDASSPTSPTGAPSTSATDAPTSGAPSGSSTADAVANDPRSVVQGFMVAFVNGDCATAEDLVTAAYIKDEGSCDPDDIPSGFEDQVTYTVGKATVNASAGTATVPVEVTYQGSKDSSTVKLVKVGDDWRINEFD